MKNDFLIQFLTNFFHSPLGQLGEKFVHVIPYIALPIIYFTFGGMKFTAYEAAGIKGLVEHSWFISWMYGFFSVQGFSNFLGVIEISVGLLILGRVISPRLSFFGGVLSAGLFMTTICMLFSTPGVIEPNLGFPAITAETGQFLLKDVGLFALSLRVALESAKALLANKRPSMV
jgi:reactive chlorine resistance protein C